MEVPGGGYLSLLLQRLGGHRERSSAKGTTARPDDSRLEALREEFEAEASFSLVFVVLKVGAPWILPLQAMAFEFLRGRLPIFLRALRTLLLGVVICALLVLAMGG
jgi:hypothetical protein